MKAIVLAISFITLLLGLIVAIGAWRNWNIFLHPPDRIGLIKLWPYSLMKGPRFNAHFFATYHLISGIVVSVVGLTLFLIALLQ